MKLIIPDFFPQLSGQKIQADLVDPGEGRALLSQHCVPNIHDGTCYFCREVGLILDLSDLPSIRDGDATELLDPETFERINLECLAMTAAVTLLSRIATADFQHRHGRGTIGGATIFVDIRPYAPEESNLLRFSTITFA